MLAGAFGAHGLQQRKGITAENIRAWATASHYAVRAISFYRFCTLFSGMPGKAREDRTFNPELVFEFVQQARDIPFLRRANAPLTTYLKLKHRRSAPLSIGVQWLGPPSSVNAPSVCEPQICRACYCSWWCHILWEYYGSRTCSRSVSMPNLEDKFTSYLDPVPDSDGWVQ